MADFSKVPVCVATIRTMVFCGVMDTAPVIDNLQDYYNDLLAEHGRAHADKDFAGVSQVLADLAHVAELIAAIEMVAREAAGE